MGGLEGVVWVPEKRKNEAGTGRRVLMIKGKDCRIKVQSESREWLPDSYKVKSISPIYELIGKEKAI